MGRDELCFEDRLAGRGVTRRQFLGFCAAMSATLGLSRQHVGRIARALAAAPRPPLLWLEFQDCTGDTESFLRAANPDVDDILLEQISLDYHETLMVPAGQMAERSLNDTLRDFAGQYVVVVEGSIPTADAGIYCTIRGRTALSIAREVMDGARATIAVGSCAWDGGLAGAAPNPTGAVGVKDAVPGLTNLVNLPGCPVNSVNLVATLIYLLTYNSLPPRDSLGRPRFAYDEEIHEHCERKHFHEADRFVLAWGDLGHRQGWCLEKMGCKGPETKHNCPVVLWNDGTSWPVAAGHGCVGCTEPHFWDRMTPFYAESDDDDGGD
jgi:hydrogenase small subunit